MSYEAFNRQYKLIVGLDALRISENDIEFDVTQTLTTEPNISNFTIYGLKKPTINHILKQDLPLINFYAGYKANMSLLSVTNARECTAQYNATDSVLYMSTGDFEEKMRVTRLNKTFRAGTPISKVMNEIIKTLDVKSGNYKTKKSLMKLIGSSNQFVNGITVSGNAWDNLGRVCKSCGYFPSIQNGTLQILKLTEPTIDETIILAPNHLIGSPEISSDGTARCKTLLDARLKPGRAFSLQSKLLRLEYVKHYGKSAPSQDWYSEIEGKFI